MTIAVQVTRQTAKGGKGCDVGIDYGRREFGLTGPESDMIKEAEDYFKRFKEPLILRLTLERGLLKCSLYKEDPSVCELRDCPRYR